MSDQQLIFQPNCQLSEEGQNQSQSQSQIEDNIPLRLVFLGNVDSGKTTLVSVLSNQDLDNGKGSARLKVFKHPHERECGRTSAIAIESGQIHQRKTMLIDLCGHERYLKTTLFGLNLVNPDYCLLIVGANMGISKMTLEHVTSALSLGYQIVICITKIDISPDHITNSTINALSKTIQKYDKRVMLLNQYKIANLTDQQIADFAKSYVPIIKISNVKGTGLEKLRTFLSRLPRVRQFDDQSQVEFSVDGHFHLKGIGHVLSGTICQGKIEIGDSLSLGTNRNNGFSAIEIKSIYHDDTPVKRLTAGHHCTIGVKDCQKKKSGQKLTIRRGMVAIDPQLSLKCKSREFTADIYILHHQTTISDRKSREGRGYQAIIHCNGIRQSAEIRKIHNEDGYIRSGDRAKVDFRFLYHDEYINPGSKFIFREGSSRGIGKVIGITIS